MRADVLTVMLTALDVAKDGGWTYTIAFRFQSVDLTRSQISLPCVKHITKCTIYRTLSMGGWSRDRCQGRDKVFFGATLGQGEASDSRATSPFSPSRYLSRLRLATGGEPLGPG